MPEAHRSLHPKDLKANPPGCAYVCEDVHVFLVSMHLICVASSSNLYSLYSSSPSLHHLSRTLKDGSP